MASSTSKIFSFRKEGNNLSLSFCSTDITVARLATAFQVEPNSLFLKEEFGDQSYWPNETGRFNLNQLYDGCSLLVMGTTSKQTQIATTTMAVTHPSPNTYTQSSASSLFAAKGNWGKKSSFSCKIIFATLAKNGKGQPQFTEKKQTFITLNEQTANLPSVTEQSKAKFGEDVILVSGNGLPIEDEVGTRGLSFWKCPSRKIYAIPPSTRKRKALNLTSDDEDSVEVIPSSSKKNMKNTLQELRNDVNAITNDLHDLKESVSSIIAVNSSLNVPLSLAKLIQDSFKCKICHATPMVPPVVASRCCNLLIGCSKCITQWYEGEGGLEKSCPNCREARGYAHTVHFKGLDDFLEGSSKMLSGSNNAA